MRQAVGKFGAVLDRFELGLGVRVVVGDVRRAVGLGDPERAEQHRDTLTLHGGPAIGVNRKIDRLDALLRAHVSAIKRLASRDASCRASTQPTT